MDYYEQYREIIDTHPSGAPASPALTEILRILFTPEEIRVAACMNFLMKTAMAVINSIISTNKINQELFPLLFCLNNKR
jgi:hypothetical protein